MGRVTVFVVETYWRSRDQIERAQLHQFGTDNEARTAGRMLSNRASGVAVYRVSGSPRLDLWDDPVMLEAFGEVPAIDPDPPPDDAAYFMIDCSLAGDTWTQIDPMAEEQNDEAA
jgi:hypothetical protein